MAAAGLIIGLLLLLLGLTGLIGFISRITPPAVVSGIQVGLGISLAVMGVKMVAAEPLIGWPILVLMLPLLKSKRFPAAIAAVPAGIVLNFLLHPGQPLPEIGWGIHLPELVLPALTDFQRGFLLITLPQLPLTLTNAVLVTTAVSRDLFGPRAARVNDRNLCLTMGAANLISAPFGGYMMCHGSGGVAAHYRFGGRTRYTVYIIGAFLLAVGLFLGKDGAGIFALIPEAALGCLLFYSGIDLAAAARGMEKRSDFFVILAVAALSPGHESRRGFCRRLPPGQGDRKKLDPDLTPPRRAALRAGGSSLAYSAGSSHAAITRSGEPFPPLQKSQNYGPVFETGPFAPCRGLLF